MKAFYKDLKLFSYNIGHTNCSYVINNISHVGLNKHPYSPNKNLYKEYLLKYQKKII